MGQVQSEQYECTETNKGPQNGSRLRENLTSQTRTNKNHNPRSATPSSQPDPIDEHVRKLSIVSNRNIQLLSMKPWSEKDVYADNLKQRRRSSLINLILGAPSSGPRFCDDLCSLNSRLSEGNFGIEFFPDTSCNQAASVASIEDAERGKSKQLDEKFRPRRSSIGSLSEQTNDGKPVAGLNDKLSERPKVLETGKIAPSAFGHQARQHFQNKSSIASTLASIDLTSSFEQHDGKPSKGLASQFFRPALNKARQTTIESLTQDMGKLDLKARASNGRVNQNGRILRRTGSELSLYSSTSAGNGSQYRQGSCASSSSASSGGSIGAIKRSVDHRKETKFIIMMQVCLPFILAGFGNMSAGLILNRVSEWKAFLHVPVFFVLLPPFIGLKGNIEMTLASRLSTLSNLNLLESKFQKRRAYASNLTLILSQAIGLSMFAALLSTICELTISKGTIESSHGSIWEISIYVVLASVLATSVVLVLISSIVMCITINLARYVQVNPDNLSTLVAALYGDVSCVLTYGLIAEWMYRLREANNIVWPLFIIVSVLTVWPMLVYSAWKFEETHNITVSSIPPMITSIIISMGSGAILSKVVGRFHLIALYQPVVNGFGANLIAVQASRVSTWLWCGALRKLSTVGEYDLAKSKKALGSLVSFMEPVMPVDEKKPERRNIKKAAAGAFRTVFWSFFNKSPNSTAARLLLVMLGPAHTIYFFVIWLVCPTNQVVLTWQFYSIYIALCLVQVFILLTICEPLMTVLMKRHLDPDVFGISLLMALADLAGTFCLAGAFFILEAAGDPNAQ